MTKLISSHLYLFIVQTALFLSKLFRLRSSKNLLYFQNLQVKYLKILFKNWNIYIYLVRWSSMHLYCWYLFLLKKLLLLYIILHSMLRLSVLKCYLYASICQWQHFLPPLHSSTQYEQKHFISIARALLFDIGVFFKNWRCCSLLLRILQKTWLFSLHSSEADREVWASWLAGCRDCLYNPKWCSWNMDI